jgi:uncharacterized protein (TIGR00730 family)
MGIQSLAVFCGSHSGNNPLYVEQAAELGKLMAKKKTTLIYGGGNVGIMGAIANAVMDNGGKVIGIIPKVLVEWERQHTGISQLIITEDMHERKRTIYSMCDAAVVLPGGFGTLDELFEMLTWNQLSIHDKEIFILNSKGFYDHLIQHIEVMQQEKFLYEKAAKRISVVNTPAELAIHL